VSGGGDPLGLALGGLGFGTAMGVGIQAVATWVVRALQAGEPNPSAEAVPQLDSPPAAVLFLGTLLGVLTAAVVTWTALAPLRNPWRQGMLGLVAAFASFALSLVAIPLDHWLGRPGILGLALLAFGAATLIGRRLPAARLGRDGGAGGARSGS
jgi:hypothetical protein